MSRSIGGRSLMTLLSIKMRPEEIDSSPATIRNVVVLPQPEGPTRTRNSLSWIDRFTSRTAWTSSKFLLTFWSATSAILFPSLGLALDRAGYAGDIMLDKERIDERHRDRAQQRPGHQLT